MSNETPITSNDKQITINVEDKSAAKWILDGVVGVGAIAQVVIGFILVCQLIAYQKSNELTQQSLDLNRKATIIAHTPWMSIQPEIRLYPADNDKILIIATAIKNTSDTPMFSAGGHFFTFPASDNPDTAKVPNTDRDGTIMPGDTLVIDDKFTTSNRSQDPKDFSAKQLQADIESGTTTVRAEMHYQDIFGQQITIDQDVIRDTTSNTYRIARTSISGYTTF